MLDMRTLQGFEARRPLALPLLGTRAVAGFPSPADDHMERRLDLNEHLVRNPISTFFLRVDGDSMSGAGILPRSEEHTSEIQSRIRISYAVFCLKKKKEL